eukprot:6030170-Prorocentrum_lima.AAC.1
MSHAWRGRNAKWAWRRSQTLQTGAYRMYAGGKGMCGGMGDGNTRYTHACAPMLSDGNSVVGTSPTRQCG